MWDARPASEASSEVQLALSLQCVSRRFQQVPRAHPLQLHLDFSKKQLAARHLAWLALPAWKDHVTSLTLYNWLGPACGAHSRMFLDPSLCAEHDVVSPLLTVLRANQRGSLRQLLGMPLRMGGVKAAAEPTPDVAGMMHKQFITSTRLLYLPHVDLSAFHLTHLGVSVGNNDAISFDNLPEPTVSLMYRAAHTEANMSFRLPGAAAQVDVIMCGGSPALNLTCSQALDGWHVNVQGESVVMHVFSTGLSCTHPCSTITGVKVVRIDARSVRMCYFSLANEMQIGLDAFLDVLCPTMP